MIRAIVKDGAIHSLGPLPHDWSEGQELVVERLSENPTPTWSDEVENAMSEIPTQDHQTLLDAVNQRRSKSTQ